MKVIINENEKGLLFKNGKFVKILSAGKYCDWGKTIEILPASEKIESDFASVENLLKYENFKSETTTIEVPDCAIALRFVSGRFVEVLPTGKYAFFTSAGESEFIIESLATPEVSDKIPSYLFGAISPNYFYKFEVAEYQKGKLFYGNKQVGTLECGTHYFWKTNTPVSVRLVDMRLTRMEINGQEILTQDKVEVRINFALNYKITDCVKIETEIDNYAEQLRLFAALTLRELIGRRKLDEILEMKEELSQFVFERLKQKQGELYVEVVDAGIKDIILPGEVHSIMNTVLMAEKRAQANVITRREEVASTRSLLNTAKLMDESETLYKLKELEFLERICQNVGTLTLNGSGDLLGQLTALIKK